MNTPCIIIDDEQLAREKIELFLEQFEWVTVMGSYATALELDKHHGGLDKHIIFLDIDLPGVDGLELGNRYYKNNYLIFTTAYSEHAVRGFELEAIDYLLKPFGIDRFRRAMHKLRDALPTTSYLMIKEGKRIHKVEVADILYIEGMREYIYWHTTKGKVIELNSLKKANAQLAGSGFIQIHKSFIINRLHVRYFESDIVGVGDQEIPIGRTFKGVVEELRNRLRN